MFDFYSRTIGNVLNLKPPFSHAFDTHTTPLSLVEMLRECSLSFLSLFYRSIEEFAAKLASNLPAPGSNLSVAQPMVELMQILSKVIETFNASLVPDDEREGVFEKTLDLAIDPLIKIARDTGHTMKTYIRSNQARESISELKFDSTSATIYLINCASYFRSVLGKHSWTMRRVDSLNRLVEDQSNQLANQESVRINSICNPDQSIEELRKSLSHFLGSLLGTGDSLSAVLPRVELISDAPIRRSVYEKVHRQIAAHYSTVYRAVQAKYSPEQLPPSQLELIFPYTPEQMELLLHI
jgi:hypothetical protein